jgi:hypothetical protein
MHYEAVMKSALKFWGIREYANARANMKSFAEGDTERENGSDYQELAANRNDISADSSLRHSARRRAAGF